MYVGKLRSLLAICARRNDSKAYKSFYVCWDENVELGLYLL